jgi:hypothetical protein
LCFPLSQALYPDNAAVLGRLRAAATAIQPHHTDRDVIELLDRDVFAPMDRAADERIQKAALRTGAERNRLMFLRGASGPRPPLPD